MQEENQIQILKEIYDMFQDGLSKELYIERLNWLITGNNRYIENIVEKSHPGVPVWKRTQEAEFISTLPSGKKLVFYGAGTFGERLLPYLKNLENVKFCDGDPIKQKEGYYGYTVISPKELVKDTEDKCIVICTTKYMDEVRNSLLSKGVRPEQIVDIRPFFCCGTGDEYFYEDFLEYEEEEIFIDAGSYDLSTTAEFFKVCKGLKKAYAFEPDKDNFKKCEKRALKDERNLPETVLLPYGTWSSSTELHFHATADGCSRIGEGETVIKTIAIDQAVSPQDRITFIKMDVEGAELESLKGAESTIRRDRPKLAICIYHKPEDMITLPLFIKSLVPEYKFYLRSYSNADNEMILYAIP